MSSSDLFVIVNFLAEKVNLYGTSQNRKQGKDIANFTALPGLSEKTVSLGETPIKNGVPRCYSKGRSKLEADAFQTLGRGTAVVTASFAPMINGNREKIRVLLADDHCVFRAGLASLLADEPDIEVVGEAGDGQQVIELARSTAPEVVLMDVTMPRMSGVDATRYLHEEMPGVRIIGLSMHSEDDMASSMRQAGAVNYLTKGGSPDLLLAAIRAG
jgi:CheY-like chemotaxis protein